MVDRLTHRILITGPSGFVGSARLRLLEAVDDAVREAKPTALVHLAAVVVPSDARDAPRLARSACGF